MALRAKEKQSIGSKWNPQVFTLVVQAALEDNDFLNRHALRFVEQVLELRSANTPQLLELIRAKVSPIVDAWFVKGKEASRALDLLRKTVAFFPPEVKLTLLDKIVPITEGKAPAPLKIKTFGIIESVFASHYFTAKATCGLLDFLNRLEEEFIQFLTNKRLVIAFFKARLQVLLNFYALDPTAARTHIPSFVSSLFEFFATDTLEEALQQQEEDAVAPQVKSRRSGKDQSAPETPPANQEVQETFRFYKRFSFRLFELLIANCFDTFLFSELDPTSGEKDINQLTDLLQNMDLEADSNSFAGKSSIAKLFILLNHTVSLRFEQNFEFTIKIVSKIVARVFELGFGKSPVFNEHLARLYRSAEALLARSTVSPATTERLLDFQADLVGA
jgi:hypothetical protein